MTFKLKLPLALGAAGLALCVPEIAAFAQDATAPAAAPAPTLDSGDTAWVLVSSVLVLAMTVPGVALFYGGLVRAKNMVSVLSQTLAVAALVLVLWSLYGYSLAFSDGGSVSAYVGGFSKAFLAGIAPDTLSGTIPEYAFVFFQGTFAAITPTLIIGSFAERVKFSALLLFSALWLTFIYAPIAHIVWFGGDADHVGAGLAFAWGALDFAGGTVVHINAGIAGLVGALVLGKRLGYGKEALPPHSLAFSFVGAVVLWFGWFGFNAGSALAANATAALASVNTLFATAGAAVSWMFVEWIAKGKPSLLGLISGVVAGLVAVTPAAGFVGPMGALVLGLVVSPISFFFVSTVKNALGYDDSLDVFGVHGIGGIVGAIGTGILAAPSLGGTGAADFDIGAQVLIQVQAVLLTLVWSGVGSFILYKIVDLIVGLRVTTDEEREGLDVASHGESAYHP